MHYKFRSDAAILADLGARVESARLSLNATQDELAREAGVSKRTVERIEAGSSSQMTSFVRVLRALGRLDPLEALLPPVGPTPMDLLRDGGRSRQRASGRRASEEQPWTWGDPRSS